MNSGHRQKVLIFIVAFNAEKHIEKVLNRIPAEIYNKYDYEILIIDDSSADKTFDIATQYQLSNPELHLKVLFNPENLGYGGNQKLGYRYAINHGFDAVVLLHGDGQYAPEVIDDLIVPIAQGKADVVFGSRMIEARGALKGGMPLYKYVGNKVLTFAQNYLLHTNLSEFHSGYRAYSVKALDSIPFERNTNDFHFDTQIIVQSFLKKLSILEVPIPTYYGDEICHVNGLKYAWDAFKATFLSKCHSASILYQREYDIENTEKPRYTSKLGYTSSHSLAVDVVAESSKVLDLGCDQGYIADELRKSKECYVVGVDAVPPELPEKLDEFIELDLNKVEKLSGLDEFDTILLLDIIEHLNNPELFLDKIREKSKRRCPSVVITVPNVAFWVIRIQLLFSHFNYGKQGILDLTHKRLFTFKSLEKICRASGYKILDVKGIPAPYPKAFGKNIISQTLLTLNKFLIHLSKNLFSYQIYMEVVPTPVVDELLEYSISESLKKSPQNGNGISNKQIATEALSSGTLS